MKKKILIFTLIIIIFIIFVYLYIPTYTKYKIIYNKSLYKKNKLNVSYIKAPLLIDINMSKNANKNFHIAAGVEFAYRIHSVTNAGATTVNLAAVAGVPDGAYFIINMNIII